MDTLQSVNLSMLTVFRFKNKTLFTRFINKPRIYQKDIRTFRLVGGLIRYRTIFTVLCVLCVTEFVEFFLTYDANWQLITAHQLIVHNLHK